ncbi:MAG: hypothetical protein IT373_15055 [Polyangiaceae bacterium]|nr:hypothetical protein [Polyangiaceae bacterium]
MAALILAVGSACSPSREVPACVETDAAPQDTASATVDSASSDDGYDPIGELTALTRRYRPSRRSPRSPFQVEPIAELAVVDRAYRFYWGRRCSASNAWRCLLDMLCRSDDPRAGEAIADYAVLSPTNPFALNFGDLTGCSLAWYPRPAYLRVVRAVLDDASGLLPGSVEVCGDGARLRLRWLCAAMRWRAARNSVFATAQTRAFLLAKRIRTEEARELLVAEALDRSRPIPDAPPGLGASCPRAQQVPVDEYRALASRRIMALAILEDMGVAWLVETDPREDPFVRLWAMSLRMGQPGLRAFGLERGAMGTTCAPREWVDEREVVP